MSESADYSDEIDQNLATNENAQLGKDSFVQISRKEILVLMRFSQNLDKTLINLFQFRKENIDNEILRKKCLRRSNTICSINHFAKNAPYIFRSETHL